MKGLSLENVNNPHFIKNFNKQRRSDLCRHSNFEGVNEGRRTSLIQMALVQKVLIKFMTSILSIYLNSIILSQFLAIDSICEYAILSESEKVWPLVAGTGH